MTTITDTVIVIIIVTIHMIMNSVSMDSIVTAICTGWTAWKSRESS